MFFSWNDLPFRSVMKGSVRGKTVFILKVGGPLNLTPPDLRCDRVWLNTRDSLHLKIEQHVSPPADGMSHHWGFDPVLLTYVTFVESVINRPTAWHRRRCKLMFVCVVKFDNCIRFLQSKIAKPTAIGFAESRNLITRPKFWACWPVWTTCLWIFNIRFRRIAASSNCVCWISLNLRGTDTQTVNDKP